MKSHQLWLYPCLVILLLTCLSACASVRQPSSSPSAGKLKVLATTTLVGDVVRNVGRDLIELSVLLPVGADPHSFEPVPQDVVRLASAEVVFANGAGLEEFLSKLLDNVPEETTIVALSDGIELIEAEGETAHAEEAEEHVHEAGDPHVWMDPNNVLHWVEQIERTLSDRDPANAAQYQANAAEYRQALLELDNWIRDQVAQVPPEQRKLVADHQVLAYFARRYQFELVGAAIPSFSTLAEPSAQELAGLEDAIGKLGVRAIFVGSTVNPALSERIARDTQIKLITIYTGSLSAPDGPAPTYLDFMRYNVNAIVQGLK